MGTLGSPSACSLAPRWLPRTLLKNLYGCSMPEVTAVEGCIPFRPRSHVPFPESNLNKWAGRTNGPCERIARAKGATARRYSKESEKEAHPSPGIGVSVSLREFVQSLNSDTVYNPERRMSPEYHGIVCSGHSVASCACVVSIL